MIEEAAAKKPKADALLVHERGRHPMKRALALTLAVAVLASNAHTASAAPYYKWQCGQYTVILHGSSFGSPEPYASIVFEPHVPSRDIHFKWDLDHSPLKQVDEPADWATFTGGVAYLNGKRCKDYVKKAPVPSQPM
jgi:hypothetical protein